MFSTRGLRLVGKSRSVLEALQMAYFGSAEAQRAPSEDVGASERGDILSYSEGSRGPGGGGVVHYRRRRPEDASSLPEKEADDGSAQKVSARPRWSRSTGEKAATHWRVRTQVPLSGPLLCNPVAETTVHLLVWCSETWSSNINIHYYPEVCFCSATLETPACCPWFDLIRPACCPWTCDKMRWRACSFVALTTRHASCHTHTHTAHCRGVTRRFTLYV